MTWQRFRRLPWWVQAIAWLLVAPLPLVLLALARRGRSRAIWAAVTAVVAVFWVSAVAGAIADQDRTAEETAANPTTTTPAQPSSTTTTPPDPSTTATTAPAPPLPSTTAPPPSAGDPLAGLRIAPEGPRTGYDRDLFRHWVDADGDRCDTREEVLISESTSPAQVDPFGCKVVAGDWFSVYDGFSTEQPGDLDIDHVVALGEAWDSGAAGWDPARREAFANDLDHPEALIAVSASSNRSKSDEDPAEWRPPRREAWCQFARDWVTVKVAWDLTADQAEATALRDMLVTC